jgi:hypothetical protein
MLDDALAELPPWAVGDVLSQNVAQEASAPADGIADGERELIA